MEINIKSRFADIPGLEEFKNVQQELFNQAAALREKVLLQACENALGRHFEISDVSDFCIARTLGSGAEILRYKDEIIGEIVLVQGYNSDGFVRNVWTIRWEFRPTQK